MELRQEKRRKKKSLFGSILVCLLILLAWAGYRYVHKPPAELPNQRPVTIQPPPAANPIPSIPEAPAPPEQTTVEQRSIGSQRHTPDKPMIVEDNSADLSSHTMSIKREEKKGFQVMPGVNVKSGVVHIQLDEDKDRTIEIEKNPDNSNSDYQVIMKKKF